MTNIKKGYKQTEIGVIPEDWEVKKLGDVGEIRMCRRIFNHETEAIGVIPFYKIGTFGKDADAYISQDLYDSYRRRFSFPKKGDVLISAAGTIGRTIVYDGKPAYFQDSNIIWIDNDEILISNRYLYYVFQIVKYNTEGGTIQRLYNSILHNTSFICSTKPEQEAIAEVLSDADALIEQLGMLIEKKKNLKQATMQQLLTGKKRLSGFSGEWKVMRLGDIAEFYKGKGLPKSAIISDGKYKCIHYGELFTLYPEEIKEVLSRTDERENFLFSHIDDVLMPTSDVTPNGLAKASCVKEEGVILGGDILVIRLFEGILDGVFLAYSIRHSKDKIMQLVSGSTVYHLYSSDMRRYELLVPPTIEEQKAITAILSDMDAEIEALEKERAKYQSIKQGMMQSLLTGAIRLAC
ncbi:MAG: restriction endonuclease subunit S [Candidatus Moraniibacteriota bacterium]